MKHRILVALGLAFPLEAVNFFLLMPPLDVGYPPGTSWWIRLIGLQWVLFHWVGLRTIDLLQGTRFAILTVPILFIGGYLELALLLILLFSVRPLIRGLRGKPLLTEQ
ncbi:MAG TPA: hypothetical protein VMD29_11920 [Terracidiphilus sp.]|nr:hypothetical protein [Terracidiphilus sp.]